MNGPCLPTATAWAWSPSTSWSFEGYAGHVLCVEVHLEAALAKAESLASRMMGPEQVMEGLVVGLFNAPRDT